jgi:hypothetical protein
VPDLIRYSAHNAIPSIAATPEHHRVRAQPRPTEIVLAPLNPRRRLLGRAPPRGGRSPGQTCRPNGGPMGGRQCPAASPKTAHRNTTRHPPGTRAQRRTRT